MLFVINCTSSNFVVVYSADETTNLPSSGVCCPGENRFLAILNINVILFMNWKTTSFELTYLIVQVLLISQRFNIIV